MFGVGRATEMRVKEEVSDARTPTPSGVRRPHRTALSPRTAVTVPAIFGVVCVVGPLYTGRVPIWLAIIPFLLQIAAAVATGMLASAYEERAPGDDPRLWAQRYTFVSAASGAAWGVGAFLWFIRTPFPPRRISPLPFSA